MSTLTTSGVYSTLYVVKYRKSDMEEFKIVKTESFRDAMGYYEEKKETYGWVGLFVETKTINTVRIV